MFSMFLDTVKLFLRGRLFRDNFAVFRSWIVGFVASVAVIVLLAMYVNVWLGAALGGFAGGAAMPYLLRNLKYN